MLPVAANVELPNMAADVVRLSAAPLNALPTIRFPLTLSVVPSVSCVTCHVPAVGLVYWRLANAVLTRTTLLTVVELAAVPVMPNMAVSAEPGTPVLGNQLAAVLQSLAPGLATFQEKVVAAEAM